MSRIIAGRAGGAKLATPSHNRTRPTTDRVREALFSAIASWARTAALPVAEQCTGLSFLDLYAGSGGVGLEAASRGAAPVVLVEKDRATAELIRCNLASTHLQGRVVTTGVNAYLSALVPALFDVVWADPPYELASAEIAGVVSRVVHSWLAPGGVVIVERSARDPEPGWPPKVELMQTRKYGETVLYFCQGPDELGDSEENHG